MGSEIKSEKKMLMDIFSEKFWFNIPEYQRPYVWQQENVRELLDDLYYASIHKSKDEYFLGSLVLKKNKKAEHIEYEVLDGQQRLTTFMLLYAVLRDHFHTELYINDTNERIHQQENKLTNRPARDRIMYRIRDNVGDFIQKYVIEKNGTLRQEIYGNIEEEKNISVYNMRKAMIVMKTFFDGKSEQELENFTKFINNYAIFIYVSTDDREDAFRMFRILNDRGISLSSADILKSINIGEVKDNKKTRYAAMWEEIEEKYGDRFDKFLYYLRNILVKEKPKGTLLEEYEDIFKKDLVKKGEDFLDLISEYDRIYQEAIELDIPENYDLIEYKNLMSIMKVGMQSEEWIPTILYYHKKFGYDHLTEFLKKIEYKFSGEWICGSSPNIRRDISNAVLSAIDKAKTPDDILNDKRMFYVDKNDLRKNLDSDIYKMRYGRYILLKIDFLLRDNTVEVKNYNKVTLEHILPQNPPADSQWLKDFNEHDRRFWTNKLGNLTILGKNKNSKLANLDFAEKKKEYLLGKTDIFVASKVFLKDIERWDVEEIKKRQKNLIDLLLNSNQ